jgi:hypothetical protein
MLELAVGMADAERWRGKTGCTTSQERGGSFWGEELGLGSSWCGLDDEDMDAA